MDWLELKVIFESSDPELAADLIADRFYAAGVTGVVIETPEKDPQADWGADAVPPPEHHAVLGYLPVTEALSERRQTIVEGMARLADRLGVPIEIRTRPLRDEDWAESWKAFFHPLRVGRRLVIKPTWHDYSPAGDDIVLEIDPGMAFGSGTHATTRMCLELIEGHLREGDRVLDVGTGSGILLLAAARLGAGEMTGVDIDDVALTVAAENLRRNGIDAERWRILQGTIHQAAGGAYDLVVANILSEVIVPIVPEVVRVLAEGGRFIASGIVAANAPKVETALAAAGLTVVQVRRLEDWVALVAVHAEG
jgi:ribosomal protein L11 methyltransferase